MTSLREALQKVLRRKELALLPTSFDIVGDIAIFSKMPKELAKREKVIAKTLMTVHPNVHVVLKKTKFYSGKLRTPRMKVIYGDSRKETVHKENGCLLKLHVEKCYFSPRLSGERLRIAHLVRKGERVLVLFSGVGVYPCVIAKNAQPQEVVGVELNAVAHRYALENVKQNKLTNVRVLHGDVKKVLPQLEEHFDRIVLPLPKDSPSYLEPALKKLTPHGVMHLYLFAQESTFHDIIERFKKYFKKVSLVRCGAYSPRVYRVCLDLYS